MSPLCIRRINIHVLSIPLRAVFGVGPRPREAVLPVILEVQAAAPYAHLVGYGEAAALPEVTGEDPTSVVEDVRDRFAPRLGSFAPTSFFETLEFLETLPVQLGGRIVTAARAAIELALLDLAGRAFRRRPADAAGWLDLPGFGAPGALVASRYSALIVGRSQAEVRRSIRLQRLWGLRDFKLYVTGADWAERLAWSAALLAGLVRRGVGSLRVDAAGTWSPRTTRDALPGLVRQGVCALEQPFADGADEDLEAFDPGGDCALIGDESILTEEDAGRLISGGFLQVIGVGIAKNGGLIPALRIARRGLAAGLDVQLGCLPGETGILAAAGRAFLEICPTVRYAESATGQWLLKQDICRRSVQAAYAGRAARLTGDGLGVEVDAARVRALAVDRPSVVQF